jgi:glycosyltransferase involved in cell wall biosynthesis
MRVGIITPDRGDRPQFMEQYYRMMDRQTLKPEVIEVVDYAPVSDDCDITPRYRYGYDKLRNCGLDVILFIESDDWYSPRYIEVMVSEWDRLGRPDLFGPNYTIYYHLGLRKDFVFRHEKRSSMMSTLIKADLDFTWPADDYPYTDSHLWINIKNKLTFLPKEMICLGIKHGVGKVGGRFHTDMLGMYKENKISLEKVAGEDYWFYDSIQTPNKLKG